MSCAPNSPPSSRKSPPPRRRPSQRAPRDLGFLALDAAAFEKRRNLYRLRRDGAHLACGGDFRRNRLADVGNWQAVWELSDKDDHGNAIRGHGVVVGGELIVRAEHTLTAVFGVKDVIVVTTDDAVLVLGAQHGDKVKELVDELKRRKRKEAREHTAASTAPGHYQSIDAGERHRSAHRVGPADKLSLQKHFHRAEHWIVVRGAAEVTRDADTVMVHERVHLPADRQRPPPGQSRQDRPGADRGADRLLSRRGRHRPHRGRLPARVIPFPSFGRPRFALGGLFLVSVPMFPKPVAVVDTEQLSTTRRRRW